MQPCPHSPIVAQTTRRAAAALRRDLSSSSLSSRRGHGSRGGTERLRLLLSSKDPRGRPVPRQRQPQSVALSRSEEGKRKMCVASAAAVAGPDVSCKRAWSRLASTFSSGSDSSTSCNAFHRMNSVAGAARRRATGPSLSLSLAASGERGVAWSRPLFPTSKLAGPSGARRAKTDEARGGGKEGGKGEEGGNAVGTGSDANSTKKGVGSAGEGKELANGNGGGADAGGASGGSGGGGGGVVGDLPHQVSELYAEMERNLMSRMHAQDKNRFRAVGLSSVLLLIWVLSMFGTEIRRYFASQTAEVARETLKVEALQVQTQELATALVQTLLNDQEVVSAGALFLREASANPETQAALVSLALYVLQHPGTLAETRVLAKKLVRSILDDPDSVKQVTDLALKVIKTPRFRQGATELVVALGQSEEVYAAVTALASRVIQDPEVQATLSTVLSASSREVLRDQVVFDHSKVFVAQVMGDDAVQRSGGDALWNTVQYALQTRLFKATGLCLLAAGSAVLFSGRGGGGRDIGGGGGDGGAR